MNSDELVHSIRQQLTIVSGKAELLMTAGTNPSTVFSCLAIRDAAFAIAHLLTAYCDAERTTSRPALVAKKKALIS
jgi:hypothetical protein